MIYTLHSLVYLLYPLFFKAYDKSYLLGISVTRGIICGLLLAGVWLLSFSYHELLYRLANLLIAVLCLASCFLPLQLFDAKDLLSEVMQAIVVIESAFYLNVFKSLHIFLFIDRVLLALAGVVLPWLLVNLRLNYIYFYFLIAGIVCHSIYFSLLNFKY